MRNTAQAPSAITTNTIAAMLTGDSTWSSSTPRGANTPSGTSTPTSGGGGALWVIVDGLEVVGEMAIEAFELMTGRKAPRNLMTRVCNETWERQSAPFQPQR